MIIDILYIATGLYTELCWSHDIRRLQFDMQSAQKKSVSDLLAGGHSSSTHAKWCVWSTAGFINS